MKRFSAVVFVLLLVALLAALSACKPVVLATPDGLRYDDGILAWDEVANADAYIVEIDGVEVARTDAPQYLYQAKGQTTFRVAAVSDKKRYLASEYSESYLYKPKVDTRATLNAHTVIEVNGDGVLIWSYVVNATGYRIYLNGTVFATVGMVTQYVLAIPDSGAFTVQVQALGSDAYRDSARSSTYRVEVSEGKIKAPKLAAPTISFDVSTHLVGWALVPNAVGYRVYLNGALKVEIAADNAAYREVSGSSYRYFYSPDINVRNARIYVVAIADGSTYSDSIASNVLSFPLVADGSPAGLTTTVIDGAVVLTWDALTNSAGYRVMVETSEGVQGIYKPTTNRIQLNLTDGTYRVSVAGDGDGYLFNPTEYSAQIEVTFAGGKLLPLALSAPQNVFLYGKTVRFDAVPHSAKYQIFIDTPYDDLQGAYTFDVTDTEYEIPAFLYGSVLTMYIRAVGETGYDVSLWSYGVCYYPVNEVEDDITEELYGEETPTEGSEEPEEKPEPIVYPNYSLVAMPVGFRLVRDALTWDALADVYAYELVVDGVAHRLTDNTFTLDMTTKHVCKIRTLSNAENVLDSPYTAELLVEKGRLDVPDDPVVQGNRLTWSTIAGAGEYVVQINDRTVRVSAASLELDKQIPYDGTYTLRVCALSAYPYYADSLYGRTVTFVADYEESGTEHKPYKIASVDDFAMLNQYPTAYFVLSGDIEVGEITSMFGPKNAFGGVLDGAGYALSDVRVTPSDVANGLFGCLYGAVIKHIDVEFAAVTFDASNTCGVLVGEAIQTTFESLTIRATMSADKSFGTVGVSNACTYRDCTLSVQYTETNDTAMVGGVVADSRQDVFERCTVVGRLEGGIYLGALAAVVNDSTVTDCTVGLATEHFLYVLDMAYAGAVGKGSLTACDVSGYATFTLGGKCYAGAMGGQLICPIVEGTVDVAFFAEADELYVGGVIGHSTVDIYDVDVTMYLTGSADLLYAGGITGYSQGLSVCRDSTSIDLQVSFTATEGRYLGGVVGFGPGTYKGAPRGAIVISDAVSVGRLSGAEPMSSTDGWTVTKE